jgi:hypothetical protein
MNSASVLCIPVIVKLVAFVFILHGSLIVGRAAFLDSETKEIEAKIMSLGSEMMQENLFGSETKNVMRN